MEHKILMKAKEEILALSLEEKKKKLRKTAHSILSGNT